MRSLVAVMFAVFAACGASPTGPSELGPLRLTASITRSLIPSGETATITFRLKNAGSGSVTLDFTDSCQLMAYIANSAGKVVYPEGGSWACAQVITSLTLAPGGAKTVDVQVRAGAAASYPYVALGAGDYSAYARVPSGEYKLQSDPVHFTVQ